VGRLSHILAINLRKYRKLRGLSQAELALKVDTHIQVISRAEQGKGLPREETLEKMSDILGIKPEFLFRTDEPLTPVRLEPDLWDAFQIVSRAFDDHRKGYFATEFF
jgi:transcriptional regulator with XRE-family HTH domain